MNKNELIEFWVKEVEFSVKQLINSEFNIEKFDFLRSMNVLPSRTSFSLAKQIIDSFASGYRARYNLKDQIGNTILVINLGKTDYTKTITVFNNLDEKPESGTNSKYYEFLKSFTLPEPFDFNGKKITALDESKGSYVFSENKSKERLVICTPTYKRPLVLRCFIKYMLKYFLPYLKLHNYEVIFALTGGAEEFESISDLISNELNNGVLFLSLENILGKKKNLMFSVAKRIDASHAITIDSDDFFHPDLVLDLISKASKNGYWSAVESIIFIEAQSGTAGLLKGYQENHSLYKWGLGSGRVFTKEALNRIGSSPFPTIRNKSMDAGIKDALKKLDIHYKDRLIEETNVLPISLKTKQNIWAFDSYKLDILSEEERSKNMWLPEEIEKELISIPYDS